MARTPLLQEPEMVPWRELILLGLMGCAAPPRAPAPEAAEAPGPALQNPPGEEVPGAGNTGSPPAPESPAPEAAGPEPVPPDPLEAALDLLDAGQEARGLAGLRRELADGERSLEAGLALASYLASRERVAEALTAIDAALLRHPEHPELALARGELLRDLGQREEAVLALRLRLDLGPSHPRVWFGLAELEWLLLRRPQALEALQRVRESPDHPWVLQEDGAIQRLEQEVQNNTAPTTMSARDLLGDLRGAPRSFDRYRALRVLAMEEGDLQTQAVTLALKDRDPSVRVQALRLGDWSLSESERLSRQALTDSAASVRAAALPLVRRIDPRIGGPMVLEALERERDPDCFRLMHEALQEMSGVRVFLPPGAVGNEEARAELQAEWREVWNR